MKATDHTKKLWEVSRLWITVDGVPHARLANQHETLMVSTRTLADQGFFVAIPAALCESQKPDRR